MFRKSSYETFIMDYKKEVISKCNLSDAESHSMARELLNLIEALNSVQEDVLFVSIGCATCVKKEQLLPTYLENLAVNKNVRIFWIDTVFNKVNKYKIFEDQYGLTTIPAEGKHIYSVKTNPNIRIEIFSCFLPPDSDHFISLHQTFCSVISRMLDRGKQVFLANHTQAYALSDIPIVAGIYNQVKSKHSCADLLQFYTQGGTGKVRYYLDKLYDEATSSPEKAARGYNMDPINDEFKVCLLIEDLATVKEFTCCASDECLSKSRFG